MSNINTPVLSQILPTKNGSESSVEKFNDKVLHYIQKNKPQGSLAELMKKMKELSSDRVTMHQLNTALLYTNTYLRHTAENKKYADEVLSKYSIQLMGVNMLYSKMMLEKFMESEDDISL
ncbi:type III secretion system protein [Enterobacter cloacae]|uniref:type III secretion system protein n=1 Tax=Enterobacter cloacae TaxID=550 RepID=UPI002FF6F240